MPKLDVLVVGSTGRQGGAVVQALLRGGHDVRALTRNLAHPAAETLRLRGARLAWADLDDSRRVEEAARGVDAMFVVTSPSPDGAAAEARRGLALAELAQRLDIPHFVYSSSMGTYARNASAQHAGKYEIEQYLRASKLPHTVICPAFFMENFASGAWLTQIRSGQLPLPIAPQQKIQQIACADLGRFVRVVLETRETFLQRRVAIAADALTPIETAATLARALGRPVQYTQSAGPAEQDAAMACGALAAEDAQANIADLRQQYPEVNWHTLADWARQQNWSELEPPSRL